MSSDATAGLGWAGMGGAPTSSSTETAERAAGVLRAMAAEPASAFYDVRVLVEGVGDAPFHAHRAVLATQSSVFRAMFLSGMREQVENEVRLGDVEPAAFAAALRHMYGGSLAGESRAVLVEVSRFAHRMDMPTLDVATTAILLRGMLAPLPELRKAWEDAVAACSSESLHPFSSGGRGAEPQVGQAMASAAAGPQLQAPPAPEHTAFGGYVPPVHMPTPAASAFGLAGGGGTSVESGQRSIFSFEKVVVKRPPSPLSFLAAEMVQVLDSEEFLSFSFELLQRILSANTIAVPEILLFERAMGRFSDYVALDGLAGAADLVELHSYTFSADTERQTLLEDVLASIRFDLMHPSDLAQARRNAIASPSPKFQARLLDALGISFESSAASAEPGSLCITKSLRLLPKPLVIVSLGVLNVFDRKLVVLRSHVLEVVASRIADGPPGHVSIKVSISCDAGVSRSMDNVVAVPYVRRQDGRKVYVGRIIDGSDFAQRNVPPSLFYAQQAASNGAAGDSSAARNTGSAPSFAQAVQAAAESQRFGFASLSASESRANDAAHESTIYGEGQASGAPQETLLVCVAIVPRAEVTKKDSPLVWTPHGAAVAARAPAPSPPAPFGSTFGGAQGFNWNTII